MRTPLDSALDRWRLADGEAHASEAVLKAAWLAHQGAGAPPPSAAMISRVTALRRAAEDSLQECYAAMRPLSVPPADFARTHVDFCIELP